MRTKTPEPEKELRRKLKLLKEYGVKAFSSESITVEFFEPSENLDANTSAAGKVRRLGEDDGFLDLDLNNPECMDVLLSNAR